MESNLPLGVCEGDRLPLRALLVAPLSQFAFMAALPESEWFDLCDGVGDAGPSKQSNVIVC